MNRGRGKRKEEEEEERKEDREKEGGGEEEGKSHPQIELCTGVFARLSVCIRK